MKSNWIGHQAEGVDWDLSERWATNLTQRMKPFVETAEELFDQIRRDGVHAASPINLSLPSIMKLCAGWAAYGSALACEHCKKQLGLRPGGAEVALAALFEARRTVAWFIARLLVSLGDTSDANGEAVPWLPDWAKPAYEAYVKEQAGRSQGMLPIYYAASTEEWGLALADNYLSMLMMELGMRLVGRSALCPAIEKIRSSWPDACVHQAFEVGAMERRDGIDELDQVEAWGEVQNLFEAYLREHADSEELVLPPPGVLLQ